jgi:hypothetical protein
MTVSGCTSSGGDAAPTLVPVATPTVTPPGVSADTVVLTINGSVGNPLLLTLSDIEAYPSVPVNMTSFAPDTGANVTAGAPGDRPDASAGTRPYGNMTDWPTGADGSLPPGIGSGTMPGADGSIPSGTGGNWQGTGNGNIQDGNYANMSGPGGRSSYAMNVTGISLESLLDSAGRYAGATSLLIAGLNGDVRTVSLADILGQQDAMIIISGREGSRTIQLSLPGNGTMTGPLVITVQ